MKWNYKLSLTLIAGFAVILPMSSFADDQTQGDKKPETKEAAGKRHEGKVTPQAVTHVSTSTSRISHRGNVQKQGGANNASVAQSHLRHGSATVQQSSVSPATSQGLQSSNQQANNRSRSQTQVSSNQQTYNKGNNYGGLWSAANTHSDWSRNGEHHWNNHNYRWYGGGWLIIDGGFSPYYSTAGYSNTGSTVSNVQIGLANQGYYHGAIDGDIGPGTRNAIANYQGDHDLRVTGHINDPLLQSLQLE